MRTPSYPRVATRPPRRRRRTIVPVLVALVAAASGMSLLAAAPASAGVVPAAHVVRAATAAGSGASKSIEAKCPAGERVLGGGAQVKNGPHVFIVGQQPLRNNGVEAYRVTAVEDQVGTTGAWSLESYAICSAPIPGLEIVSATSIPGSFGFQVVSARCSINKQALGSGGKIVGGQNQVGLSTQVGGGPVFSDGIAASGLEDSDGFAENWTVTAYAVCATVPLLDLDVVTVSAGDALPSKTLTATCPAGKHVTGGTSFVGLPGAAVQSIAFDDARTRVRAVVRNDTEWRGSWSANATAICV